jgi:hypothetical protein
MRVTDSVLVLCYGAYVVVPVDGEKYRLFFPTELFDELTKGQH